MVYEVKWCRYEKGLLSAAFFLGGGDVVVVVYHFFLVRESTNESNI